VVVVEPVRVEALGAYPGVEVQLAASEPSALLDQPVKQRAGMSLTARLRDGR